jgi:hypothetical protein
MGEVVWLKETNKRVASPVQHLVNDSMAPMKFAVGFAECNRCIAKLAEYGVDRVQVQMIKDKPGALVNLVRVEDALWLNKQILELEDLCEKDIADRIDLIQMLENINLPMIESLVDCFTGKTSH